MILHLDTHAEPDVIRTIDVETDAGEIVLHDIICTDDETHRATSSYTLTDAELLGQALILAVAQARNIIVGQRELFA